MDQRKGDKQPMVISVRVSRIDRLSGLRNIIYFIIVLLSTSNYSQRNSMFVMAWLLSAGNYVNQKIQQLRGKGVYPSEAVIDQMMPPEILAQIFLNLDCSAMASCIFVSKYWRHYATEETIQEHVLQQSPYSRGADEMKMILARKAPSFDLNKKIKWREYAADYPRKFITADRLLAAKAGKFLLELDSIYIARSINYTLAPQRPGSPLDDIIPFWVKIRGKFSYDPDSDNLNIMHSGNVSLSLSSYFVHGGQSKCYQLSGTECEVIMEFTEVPNEVMDFKSLIKVRVLGRNPYTLPPKY